MSKARHFGWSVAFRCHPGSTRRPQEDALSKRDFEHVASLPGPIVLFFSFFCVHLLVAFNVFLHFLFFVTFLIFLILFVHFFLYYFHFSCFSILSCVLSFFKITIFHFVTRFSCVTFLSDAFEALFGESSRNR